MKLSEIAQKLACRLEGAPDTEIRGIAGIEHAEPGQITFLANRRYFPLLKTTRASAVLIEDGISLERHGLTVRYLLDLNHAYPAERSTLWMAEPFLTRESAAGRKASI